MKRSVLTINGKKDSDIELPNVFETEVNRTLIHRAFINLQTHSFQKHSTKPTAGMEVVADSNDPPTGRGVARIAKIKGGGGGRAGQAGTRKRILFLRYSIHRIAEKRNAFIFMEVSALARLLLWIYLMVL